MAGPQAEIDLAALRHNLACLQRRLAPETAVLAAVKADAYGHGAVRVAAELEQAGVRMFGVATPEEALELRAAGITHDILLFSPAYHRLPELIDAGVRLCVCDERSVAAAAAAGSSSGRVAVHLKIDTGMGRLGLPWNEAVTLARAVDRHRGLELEGVWTHLARADEPDRTPTEAQLEAFERALTALARDGIAVRWRHAANSAGIVAYPEAQYDLVRPGIALYGYHASDAMAALEPELRPVMRLTAPVTFVKRVQAGTPISYGGQWRAPVDTRIATVRIGYADGYPRALSGRAAARWRGAELPLAGRVCMDQLMLDCGEHELEPGERVTLWGPEGPDAEELAQRVGTISYELLTGVSPRVERVYRNGSAATPTAHPETAPPEA